jgi:hypothetical protein
MRPAARHLRAPILAAIFAAAVLAPERPALAAREGYTYLSYVGPEVSLVSPADEDSAARLNMPVLPGDVLVTGTASRAEAILADGNVVRIDGRSELRFERLNRTWEGDDDRTILALARGTAAVEVREVSTRDGALRLDTDDATVVSPARSVFRVDAGRRGTEIWVLAGSVEVNSRAGHALVRAGEYAFASADSDLDVEAADAPRDRFARFLAERRDRADRRDVTRYVGSDYAYDFDAASFDDYGSWTYVGALGAYGWRPSVGPGWTPYSLGYWRWTPAGLTWVSYEPWGWLPYHYGTWSWDPVLGWVWIPAPFYSPAWVYWSYGPDWTGWCPAGWIAYDDPIYRSTRAWHGNERNGGWLPRLRGRVEITQIDRRGWNFVPTARMGERFQAGRDVTRGDRVPFPRGETVTVSTAPLRVARGSSPAASVQAFIHRAAAPEAPARGGTSDGLTSILRRDRVLDAAGQQELRRSVARASRDSGLRPAAMAPSAGRDDGRAGWRTATDRPSATRGPDAPVARRDAAPARTDDGWRSSSSPAPAPVERRTGERRDGRGDSGWRAPSPRVVERSNDRPPSRERGDGARREAPARRDAPVFREAPAYRQPPAPRQAPVFREAPAFRQAPAPREAPAPRAEQAPAARRER